MVRKVTKIDLVDAVYTDTKLERQAVQAVVDSFLTAVKKSLIKGASIELRGFGSFLIKTRKGRKNARNPRTGEIVEVNAHSVAVFKPGTELKTAVRSIVKKNKS